jgi:hypothetical protein
MPSTFTVNTGIELPAAGEQSGTWGGTVNLNMDIIDRAINGVASITLSGTSHTLLTRDGVLSDGQFRVLVFGGSPSGTNTVTVSPNDAQKLYFVKNGTAQRIILVQGSGTTVSVEAGDSDIVYCDGGGSGASVSSLTADLSSFLIATNNLSDLDNAATALTNLGVTATAAELNIMDGVTATTAEINYSDVTTLGESEASKVVTADSGGKVYLNGAVRHNVTAVAALDIDCSASNYFTKAISGDSTFTFSNAPASGTSFGFTLELTHTSGVVTWPTAVEWPADTAPSLTTGNTHLFMFVTDDGGTVWHGAALVDYAN